MLTQQAQGTSWTRWQLTQTATHLHPHQRGREPQPHIYYSGLNSVTPLGTVSVINMNAPSKVTLALHTLSEVRTSCSDLTQKSWTVLAAFLATAKERLGSTEATFSSLQTTSRVSVPGFNHTQCVFTDNDSEHSNRKEKSCLNLTPNHSLVSSFDLIFQLTIHWSVLRNY